MKRINITKIDVYTFGKATIGERVNILLIAFIKILIWANKLADYWVKQATVTLRHKFNLRINLYF